MRIDELGEKKFLAQAIQSIGPTLDSRLVGGIGHDAALIDTRLCEGEGITFKIDRAAQPVAARRGWCSYEMWGRLAVTTVCSDLLCVSSEPLAFMLACILPGSFEASAAEAVIQGAAAECRENGLIFAGGDTKEGPFPEVVGSGLGLVDKTAFLTRTGAQPGDLLVLAGDLGGYLGAYLQCVSAEAAGAKLRPDWIDYVSRPRAQWQASTVMRQAGLASAAMDCSDGLYEAASVLSGGYGCLFDLSQFPYHNHATEAVCNLGVDLLRLGLGVGDWNLVYVVPRDRESELVRVLSEEPSLRVIGEVISDTGIHALDAHGIRRTITPIVNEHFAARQEDEVDLLQKASESPFQ